jgi:hypothetical protein
MTGPRYAFFLGGHDLEMITIAALLVDLRSDGDARVADICDPGLSWGARASDHGDEINDAARSGLVPVLVELIPDITLPPHCVLIDHHGDRSAEPSALRQIFDLLSLPPDRWTRDFALVAANDTGHVGALRRMGATDPEIADIRARDRRAQGITEIEEAQGRAALERAETLLDGSLIVVRLPHARTATVTDPLALQGEESDILVLCPGSVQFFGRGDRITRLDAALPGGWRGGELPKRGFWGVSRTVSLEEIISLLV